jgi:chromosome segregation ATPase
VSELVDDLVEQLREVLAERPTTEAELRSLSERAHALERRLAADVDADEERLGELSADPASSLAETAAVLRRVDGLRIALDRARALLENLDERSRRLRTEWLLNQAGSQRADDAR